MLQEQEHLEEEDNPIHCPPEEIKSPPTLFKVIATAPLRKHIAILNKNEPPSTLFRIPDSHSSSSQLNIEQCHSIPSANINTKMGVVPVDEYPYDESLTEALAIPNTPFQHDEVPPSEPPSTDQTDVVIILSDDDEDIIEENTKWNLLPTRSVLPTLGKRKAIDTAEADFAQKRVSHQPISNPSSDSNSFSASGSQSCPVELDSDSDEDIPTKPTTQDKGSVPTNTAGSPIFIMDEHEQSLNEDCKSEISWTSVPKPLPPVFSNGSGSSNNVQEKQEKVIQSGQQLQRSYYTGDGRGYIKKVGISISNQSSDQDHSIIQPSQSPPPYTSQHTQKSDLEHLYGPDGECLLPFEISVDGTDFSEMEKTMKTIEEATEQGKRFDPRKSRGGFDLSVDQLYVLDQALNHHRNVFFTGSAGTGKSVLLRELILRLRAQNSRMSSLDDYDAIASGRVAVTASTGIAACNIGGCTLHSFAGIGLGNGTVAEVIARVRANKNTVRRWKHTGVLIVDEISMIDGGLLDKLEELARAIRGDQRPWGGIQVVLCGDFFQLPPVDRTGKGKFCFEADCWSKTIHSVIQLGQIFRQKDHSFATMLNQMRIGCLTSSSIRAFRNLNRDITVEDGIKPTDLFPLRRQVEDANMGMLRKLEGESLIFDAIDAGVYADKMEQQCIAPTKLEIKVNAQVMLLKNQNGGAGGLVNGSIGKIIEFVREPATNRRMGSGPNGQPLSSLDTEGELLPKVRFNTEHGIHDMVVGREEWKIELPNGTILGSRTQVPLCLAWALSIHKSQGQTLTKVRVDLGRVFEAGQAYVALSRATTLEGLQVLNFDQRKVMVHPKVVEFYEKIEKERNQSSSS